MRFAYRRPLAGRDAKFMFVGFDKSLLDSPDFKEDGVREVIITPILTRLGFTPSGKSQVVRSKSLTHPFIYAGTRKLPIKLIPDYTLIVDGKPLCVLDAKSPRENMLSTENVQQAYSYAIHPEIKCHTFALCNGKSLVVFNTDENVPELHISFDQFESRWIEIEKHLSPRHLKLPALKKFAPDFGKALSRLNLRNDARITMLGVRMDFFARIDADLLCSTANTKLADEDHCATFDFNSMLLPKIVSGLPNLLRERFTVALNQAPFKALAEFMIEVDLDMHLGAETKSGSGEMFIPLVIDNVMASRFNPNLAFPNRTDIPDDVFRLSSAVR